MLIINKFITSDRHEMYWLVVAEMFGSPVDTEAIVTGELIEDANTNFFVGTEVNLNNVLDKLMLFT